MPTKIEKSESKNKKYVAILSDGKKVHFGDSRYQHYKDTTPITAYSHLDHNDPKRKKSYYARHGPAEPNTAKYFSHRYLW